jgi:hypothetical protein
MGLEFTAVEVGAWCHLNQHIIGSSGSSSPSISSLLAKEIIGVRAHAHRAGQPEDLAHITAAGVPRRSVCSSVRSGDATRSRARLRDPSIGIQPPPLSVVKGPLRIGLLALGKLRVGAGRPSFTGQTMRSVPRCTDQPPAPTTASCRQLRPPSLVATSTSPGPCDQAPSTKPTRADTNDTDCDEDE